MIKLTLTIRIYLAITIVTLISCKDNKLESIQGVFTADKESLKKITQDKVGNTNAFASALLDKVIENAVIEFKISDDSIKGIMFLAGQTNAINSRIQIRNDSLFIKSENTDIHIIPNDKGFLFKDIQMIKSSLEDLSTETKNALTNFLQKRTEIEELIMGEWKKENFVDEFKDKTDEGYATTIVSGSHETSTTVNSDVYVKCIVSDNKIYFEIYNSTMSFKENFPESEFGTVKIKFPNGEVKTERVFFYQNAMFESEDNKDPLIYNYLVSNEGELKILIDLSTASRYQSGKYQFTIKKGNLDKVLSEIKGE